jgi:hypothetical protein
MPPDPPNPFNPLAFTLPAGEVAYRMHENRFRTTEFNPGPKGAGRFHFFGDPMVSVLYAAETEAAAVGEILLRNIPGGGGQVSYGDYQKKVMAAIETRRDIRLASFLGDDCRALRVLPEQLTGPGETSYPQTRKWAAAAYEAGFEGIAWMSKRSPRYQAYMFFGDRVSESDFAVVPGSARIFAAGPDQDWLIEHCGLMHIDVLPAPIT